MKKNVIYFSIIHSFYVFSCPTENLKLVTESWEDALEQVYLARDKLSDVQRDTVSQWLQVFQKCGQEVVGSQIELEVLQRYLNGFVEQLEDQSVLTDCLLFNSIKSEYFNAPEYVYFKAVIKQSIADNNLRLEESQLEDAYGDSCKKDIADVKSKINVFAKNLEDGFHSRRMLGAGNITANGCPAGFLQSAAKEWIRVNKALWEARKQIKHEDRKTVEPWLAEFYTCTNQFIGQGVGKKAMAEYLRTIINSLKSFAGDVSNCRKLNLVKSENFEKPEFQYFRAVIEQSLADVEQGLTYSRVRKQFGYACEATIGALQNDLEKTSSELESEFVQNNL